MVDFQGKNANLKNKKFLSPHPLSKNPNKIT